jgi:hypothetical protein
MRFSMSEEELEAVRFRAYQIWEREGRPHGRNEEHWLRACKELGLDEPAHDGARYAIAGQTRDWDTAEEQR